MDSNFVRIVDKDKLGGYLVLHRRDLTADDVLFDEKKHGAAALAAKKPADPPKQEPTKSDSPKPSAPPPAAKK